MKELLLQNLWIVAFAVAVLGLAPLLRKISGILDAMRATKKTVGLADLGLQLAALFARAAAAGVVQVESKMRPALKAAGADGKISPEDAATCRKAAAEAATDWLKATAPAVLEEAGINLDALPRLLLPHVETQAAILAGGSRAALLSGDTTPGGPP